MIKRINIVLPGATIQDMDMTAQPGQRTPCIDRADELLARLELAAVRDRDVDREIAADWSAVDKEAWLKLDSAEPRNPDTRSGVKSVSRRSIPR